MRALLTVFGIFAMGSMAAAEMPEALKKCRAIKDAMKRLECFDDVAKPVPTPASPSAAEGDRGRWQSRTETSKIDDSTNVYLTLESTEPVQTRLSFGSRNAHLIIRCKEGKTGMYVAVGVFLGSDGTNVTYRIDKEPAKKEWWVMSNDHKAIGTWESPRTIPFIKSLFAKSELVFSVTPYSESTVIVTFPIAGIEEAIKPVAAACKWPEPRPTSKPPTAKRQ